MDLGHKKNKSCNKLICIQDKAHYHIPVARFSHLLKQIKGLKKKKEEDGDGHFLQCCHAGFLAHNGRWG